MDQAAVPGVRLEIHPARESRFREVSAALLNVPVSATIPDPASTQNNSTLNLHSGHEKIPDHFIFFES